jgi:hypothetical protein
MIYQFQQHGSAFAVATEVVQAEEVLKQSQDAHEKQDDIEVSSEAEKIIICPSVPWRFFHPAPSEDTTGTEFVSFHSRCMGRNKRQKSRRQQLGADWPTLGNLPAS